MKKRDFFYQWIKDPKNKSISRLITIFAIGVLLLVLSKFLYNSAPMKEESTSEYASPPLENTVDISDPTYVDRLEQQLSDVLGKVQGVKNVNVVITLMEEELVEPAFNVISNEKISEERDGDGGVRTVTEIQSTQQAVLLRKGSDDAAMILKKTAPKVKGVLIVADGANSSKIVEKITKATATLLDIPLYKVSVLSK